MLRKSVLVVFCTLLLGPTWSALAAMDPDLVAWWAFDEGQGTVAFDGSGNGNDGTLTNGPAWVPGQLGTALQFNGSNSSVRAAHIPFNNRSFTIAMWINPVLNSAATIIFSQSQSSAANLDMHFRLGGPGNTAPNPGSARMGFYSNDLDTPAGLIQSNIWCHLTFWYDYENRIRRIYVNGQQVAQGTAAAPYLGTSGNTVIGSWASGEYFNGIIDDVQVYHKALSDNQIKQIMTGLRDASLASTPSPENETTDVHQDAVLSWTAGATAATHDVYFGTSLADVDAAGRGNPMGVLASQGQTAVEFNPDGLLEFGQTYYWRIDEVNAAPDGTIFKGEVWSFTAEPFAYPVTGITATASSSAPKQGSPSQTIGGVGLNADDQHSVDGTQMWLATAMPAWIQYEFDKVYKLQEMWVWNANQGVESFVGFGAKDVTIEYSLDGQSWETLSDVPQFTQAPGLATYTANTTVNFGGAQAKYVRLTITENWGFTPQAGLSEVRFFAVPVQAREPQPVVAATGVSVDVGLDWRPGREATSHEVHLGADSNSVRDSVLPAGTVTDHGYSPADLTFATQYFWRVDEVGDAGTYPGEVWSFTTQDYAPVDDFEGYNDDDNRIFDAWIDGYLDHSSGSTVGYIDAVAGTFGERSIVHRGTQSMPLTYDNTVAPFYSEAELTLNSPQDWTTNGADTLTLFYQGITPGFVQTTSGTILMNGIGSDIWGTSDQFRFAYKTLTGNGTIVARVHSLYNTPGGDGWSKGGVMIRQSTEPGSTHASTVLTGASGNGASFQRRLVAAGDSTNNDADVNSPATKPYWVKVERVGDAYSSYISPDGVAWRQLGAAQTIPMTGSLLIGLAVCSHNATALTGAEFSDVKTTGNVTGEWQLADIGAAQQEGNSLEGLYLTVKDSAGKTKTLVNPDAVATGRMGWQQWKIPLSDLTSAGLKANSIKTITVGVGNRTSPVTGGAGKIYIDDIGYGRPLP